MFLKIYFCFIFLLFLFFSCKGSDLGSLAEVPDYEFSLPAAFVFKKANLESSEEYKNGCLYLSFLIHNSGDFIKDPSIIEEIQVITPSNKMINISNNQTQLINTSLWAGYASFGIVGEYIYFLENFEAGAIIWAWADYSQNDQDIPPEEGEYSFKVKIRGKEITGITRFNPIGSDPMRDSGNNLYPSNINYTPGSRTITWDGISGAQCYRVLIYKGSENVDYDKAQFIVYNTNGLFITETSHQISGDLEFQKGQDYVIKIDGYTYNQYVQNSNYVHRSLGFIFTPNP